jgi:hypothetical protein
MGPTSDLSWSLAIFRRIGLTDGQRFVVGPDGGGMACDYGTADSSGGSPAALPLWQGISTVSATSGPTVAKVVPDFSPKKTSRRRASCGSPGKRTGGNPTDASCPRGLSRHDSSLLATSRFQVVRGHERRLLEYGRRGQELEAFPGWKLAQSPGGTLAVFCAVSPSRQRANKCLHAFEVPILGTVLSPAKVWRSTRLKTLEERAFGGNFLWGLQNGVGLSVPEPPPQSAGALFRSQSSVHASAEIAEPGNLVASSRKPSERTDVSNSICVQVSCSG